MSGVPWSSAQVRLVVACNVGGLVLVGVSAAAAGGDSLRDQVLWLNLAVLSTLFTVVANSSLFLAARRAIGRRRLALVPDVDVPQPAVPSSHGDRWCRVPGTKRAHRLGCPMIEGRPWAVVAAETIRAEGLQRCELCG